MAVVRSTGFLPGEKVSLFERWNAGSFNPGNAVVDTQTVGDDSVVVFEGLEAGTEYWVAVEREHEVPIVGGTRKVTEWARAAVSAKDPVPAKKRLSASRVRAMLSGTKENRHRSNDPKHGVANVATPSLAEKSDSPEAVPHLGQADIPDDVPQRSSTPLGRGTPKPVEEPVPAVDQRETNDVPQRSDTPLGRAVLVTPGEQVPAGRQEDSKGPQRSDTELGRQEPKPADSVEFQIAKDSSVSRADGRMAEETVAGVPTGDEAPAPKAKAKGKSTSKKKAGSK